MKNALIRTQTVVKKSPIHGFGVFAAQDFQVNDIIEECYFLRTKTQASEFIHYYFYSEGDYVLVLGDGSIYNHSQQPNALHFLDDSQDIMTIQACHPISKGEEIFINYGDNWFDSRHVKAKEKLWSRKYRKVFSITARFLMYMLLMGSVIALLKLAS